MQKNSCWCPVCQVYFETHHVTERWLADKHLFIPAHEGGWLNLAAHLAYESDIPLVPRRTGVYHGPYSETPPCRSGLWTFEGWRNGDRSGGRGGGLDGTITCWCGDKFGGLNLIERFAEHLWVSNDTEDGGLDQHFHQAMATKILGAM